jgi:hypothetical protein
VPNPSKDGATTGALAPLGLPSVRTLCLCRAPEPGRLEQGLDPSSQEHIFSYFYYFLTNLKKFEIRNHFRGGRSNKKNNPKNIFLRVVVLKEPSLKIDI